MVRKASAVEVNKFNAGLITDASPLTSPDNSSIDEFNMVLNIDGSRNRRLGLDFEDSYSEITTTIAPVNLASIAIATYHWENAGGDPEKSLEVIQIGNQVKVFDLDTTSISDGLIATLDFPSSSVDDKFAYAVVDGILVIATGQKTIYYYTFEAPNVIESNSTRLLVRDLWGVEDVIDGVDLIVNTNVQNRPDFLDLTSEHLYNLRNQSWGVSRIHANNEVLIDPLGPFKDVSGGLAPSNADTVTEALYPDAEDIDNRTIDRFFADNLYKNPLGTSRAAQGYFIIDALDRGASRLAEDVKNRARYTDLSAYTVNDLPTDSTPTGATALTEFAGRMCYAGFSGAVVDGDKYSPKMSSYVLFSKVVDSPADLNICYQEGDPTSKLNPEIIDTDGGFIRINEAYGIRRLISLGSSLMVVASNGVWRITGGSDNGFTATSYIVEKISDKGCVSQDSIVVIDNSFMFWGKDAIYHVTIDQFGSWTCNNITFGRIQRLFDSISVEDKREVSGHYDNFERKVRWLYYNKSVDDVPTYELVLDVQLQAYYPNRIDLFDNASIPKVVSTYIAKPYTITTTSAVYQREVGYLTITQITPVVKYTFSQYRNTQFRDWYSMDGVGIDAAAYTVTSYLSGSDFQRDKQVPYITIHLKRTETGFDVNMLPLNQSSCLVQARWDWSDSGNSGKWGREFQAYRYRRLYIPSGPGDDYDNGFETVVTRNKLRGNGKVLSLKFSTEPYKDLHLYGWSMIFSVAENV